MKRTRQDERVYSESSSSESDTLEMHQALPVSDGDLGDLSLPPCDPEQYLRRVRHEAHSLPDVVYWKEWFVHSTESGALESRNRTEETNYLDQEFEFLRSEKHMELFNQVRECLALEGSDSEALQLPEATDMKAWESLCWSFQGTSRELCSLDKLPWKELSSLDHLRCVSLVGLFEKWYRSDCSKSLESFKIEEERSRLVWLFGILAALQPPLHADTEASIRSLLRHLLVKKRQYENMETDHQLIDMVHTLIAVVCHEFHQGYGIIE